MAQTLSAYPPNDPGAHYGRAQPGLMPPDQSPELEDPDAMRSRDFKRRRHSRGIFGCGYYIQTRISGEQFVLLL